MSRALITAIGAAALAAFAYLTSTISNPNAPAPDVEDLPAPATIVRLLDVGQGDATYIRNGDSRVIIDGGPNVPRFGRLLDSLGLNNTTIDIVIISHAHYDHYNGLRALFDSRRNIKIRYIFENKDPAPAITLGILRDSIISRMRRDSLIYRSTDDPCGNGSAVCTVTLKGGSKLHIMKPLKSDRSQNNRSVAVKLVGADSASFSMWFSGDAEKNATSYYSRTGYAFKPGMKVDILKGNHHGSCNGITTQFLRATRPKEIIVSLADSNDYGHIHDQTKSLLEHNDIPWYRTDQNGTITIMSPGTAQSGYTVSVSRGTENMNGRSDRKANQRGC